MHARTRLKNGASSLPLPPLPPHALPLVIRSSLCNTTPPPLTPPVPPLPPPIQVLRTLNLLALEVSSVLHAEASPEEIAADELLPLFVFVIVRARVAHLYTQARFVSDFIPKHYALGRHGYSLATLQAALQYLLETSWVAIRAAAAREKQLRDEQRRQRLGEQHALLARQSNGAGRGGGGGGGRGGGIGGGIGEGEVGGGDGFLQPDRLVELCDCPYGCTHGVVMRDSLGRILRRGDHLVRGSKQRPHHGIFYGGAGGSDVVHYARRRKDGGGSGRAGLRDREYSFRASFGGGGSGAADALRSVEGGGAAAVRQLRRMTSDKQVSFETIEEFARGEGLYVVSYPDAASRCDAADAVLQRARDGLGVAGLDLFHLSCEQFAIKCKTGGAPSDGPRPVHPARSAAAAAAAIGNTGGGGGGGEHTSPMRRRHSSASDGVAAVAAAAAAASGGLASPSRLAGSFVSRAGSLLFRPATSGGGGGACGRGGGGGGSGGGGGGSGGGAGNFPMDDEQPRGTAGRRSSPGGGRGGAVGGGHASGSGTTRTRSPPPQRMSTAGLSTRPWVHGSGAGHEAAARGGRAERRRSRSSRDDSRSGARGGGGGGSGGGGGAGVDQHTEESDDDSYASAAEDVGDAETEVEQQQQQGEHYETAGDPLPSASSSTAADYFYESSLQLAGTDADAPRPLEGATRPRKDQAALALGVGFEVYGVCCDGAMAQRKRAQLLLVLQSRGIVYADVAAATALRELVLAFLDGGGYDSVGYMAFRTRAQRRLSHVISTAMEGSMSFGLSEHGSPLGALGEGGGTPMLVPASRRLAKKLGDLLQLCYIVFDWQPTSATSGSAHAHGSGPSHHFAADVQEALVAFSHGLVFERSPADDALRLAAASPQQPSGSATHDPTTASPLRPLSSPGCYASGYGPLESSPGSSAASPPSLFFGASHAEEQAALHQMRMLAAAMHLYLDSCLPPPGLSTTSPAAATRSPPAGSPPSTVTSAVTSAAVGGGGGGVRSDLALHIVDDGYGRHQPSARRPAAREALPCPHARSRTCLPLPKRRRRRCAQRRGLERRRGVRV